MKIRPLFIFVVALILVSGAFYLFEKNKLNRNPAQDVGGHIYGDPLGSANNQDPAKSPSSHLLRFKIDGCDNPLLAAQVLESLSSQVAVLLSLKSAGLDPAQGGFNFDLARLGREPIADDPGLEPGLALPASDTSKILNQTLFVPAFWPLLHKLEEIAPAHEKKNAQFKEFVEEEIQTRLALVEKIYKILNHPGFEILKTEILSGNWKPKNSQAYPWVQAKASVVGEVFKEELVSEYSDSRIVLDFDKAIDGFGGVLVFNSFYYRGAGDGPFEKADLEIRNCSQCTFEASQWTIENEYGGSIKGRGTHRAKVPEGGLINFFDLPNNLHTDQLILKGHLPRGPEDIHFVNFKLDIDFKNYGSGPRFVFEPSEGYKKAYPAELSFVLSDPPPGDANFQCTETKNKLGQIASSLAIKSQIFWDYIWVQRVNLPGIPRDLWFEKVFLKMYKQVGEFVFDNDLLETVAAEITPKSGAIETAFSWTYTKTNQNTGDIEYYWHFENLKTRIQKLIQNIPVEKLKKTIFRYNAQVEERLETNKDLLKILEKSISEF
jgi:hypothetical protein